MMSSRPLCAARCSAVKCWLSYEFGFAFPLVNNVWEKKKRFRDYYYNLLMFFKKADNKKGCGENAEIKIQKLNIIHVRKPLKC